MIRDPRKATTRSRSSATALTVVGVMLAVGCSSPATPPSAYYLLRGETSALPPAAPEQRAGIARVEVAPYLDRVGIVLGLGPNEVREARYHLWAEPLPQGVHYYLEERISALLGYRIGGGRESARAWARSVAVRVRELHGDEDGSVRLVAGVTVTSVDGTLVAEEQFSGRTQQVGEGYPALVAAHIQLLDELAEAIATLLR